MEQNALLPRGHWLEQNLAALAVRWSLLALQEFTEKLAKKRSTEKHREQPNTKRYQLIMKKVQALTEEEKHRKRIAIDSVSALDSIRDSQSKWAHPFGCDFFVEYGGSYWIRTSDQLIINCVV